MAKTLVQTYVFDATAKTVTLTDFTLIYLERLQLIVDTTTNTILYNFADSTVATATVATNVVTLSTVTGAASSDKLMIIYDTITGDPTYDQDPVTMNTLMAGEDLTNNRLMVEERFSYQAITTAATTTVKSGSGFLHAITITGGVAGTISIWDNTAGSGTSIGFIDVGYSYDRFPMNVSFATGLTIVTSQAIKLTISYR